MSKRPAAPRVLLTDRALSDLAEIERFSVAEFGKQTAAKHLAGFESALSLIKQNPGLLVAEPDFHPDLRFYRVAKHLLACDVGPKTIIVLTVLHASRDLPSRLAELEPKLQAEVELLRERLKRS